MVGAPTAHSPTGLENHSNTPGQIGLRNIVKDNLEILIPRPTTLTVKACLPFVYVYLNDICLLFCYLFN